MTVRRFVVAVAALVALVAAGCTSPPDQATRSVTECTAAGFFSSMTSPSPFFSPPNSAEA